VAENRCLAIDLDAFNRLEVLESTAEAMIDGRPLGRMVPMSDAAIAELEDALFKESRSLSVGLGIDVMRPGIRQNGRTII
jgi:hypothetical protein